MGGGGRDVFGRLEEGKAGRGGTEKALIVIAAEADGPGIGRVRMSVIDAASVENLHSFVQASVEPGSTVHTDGWPGYRGLAAKGYEHQVTKILGRKKEASRLLPRVHRVASLVKRWLLGTHQGAVSHQHLVYYLDEFTFRFIRRKSRSRGKLFFRLVEQALATAPEPYGALVTHAKAKSGKTQPVGAS
jgi:transposase-like protein